MTGQLLLGLLSGLAAALLYASALTGSALAVFLFYLAPLPLLLAGLGWGWPAAAVAAAVGGLVTAVTADPRAGLFFVATAAAPATWLCHLALLSRPVPAAGDDEPKSPPTVEWYPIGRLVLWIAGMSVGLALAALMLLGPGEAEFRENVAQIFRQLLNANPDVVSQLGRENDVDSAISAMTTFLLPLTAASWMVSMLINLWLAARLLRSSDRLRRPWPPIVRLSYPPAVSAIYVASLILALVLPGTLGMTATIVAAALTMALLLVGLAVLHAATHGLPSRPLILAALYVALFIFAFTGLVLAVIGAVEPFVRIRDRTLPSVGPKQPD